MYLCKRFKITISEEGLRESMRLYTNINPTNRRLKPKSYFCLNGEDKIKNIHEVFFKENNVIIIFLHTNIQLALLTSHVYINSPISPVLF